MKVMLSIALLEAGGAVVLLLWGLCMDLHRLRRAWKGCEWAASPMPEIDRVEWIGGVGGAEGVCKGIC